MPPTRLLPSRTRHGPLPAPTTRHRTDPHELVHGDGLRPRRRGLDRGGTARPGGGPAGRARRRGGGVVVGGRPGRAGLLSAVSGALLLIGGHRANHGLGGPVDRMLTELFDRARGACLLAQGVGGVGGVRPGPAVGALVALCASYLSSYVRARGAARGYSVEESHVTRGLRYGVLSAG